MESLAYLSSSIYYVEKVTEVLDQGTTLVFIDPAVDDFSSLLRGLKSNSEAVILNPCQDGVSQITNFLAQYSGTINSIQILSHGAAGTLQLGSTWLSTDNLDQYQSALSKWFTSVAGQTPDLLLYGCNVASGEIGIKFINQLSAITGADVAASVDLTSSVAKGGNWILEKATGSIEATSAFSQTVKDAYKDILATFTVTNTSDSGAGSLRQAILDANSTSGLDNIFFDPTIKLIKPNSPLPNITDPVNLDGRPGQGGTLPGVEINGLNAGTQYKENSGIQLYGPKTTAPAYAGADGSTIRGLSITGFWGNGLLLFQTDNNTVEYNHINDWLVSVGSVGNDSMRENPSMVSNPATERTYVIKTPSGRGIKVRALPIKDSEPIDGLDEGAKVTAKESGTQGWLQITTGSFRGGYIARVLYPSLHFFHQVDIRCNVKRLLVSLTPDVALITSILSINSLIKETSYDH